MAANNEELDRAKLRPVLDEILWMLNNLPWPEKSHGMRSILEQFSAIQDFKNRHVVRFCLIYMIFLCLVQIIRFDEKRNSGDK